MDVLLTHARLIGPDGAVTSTDGALSISANRIDFVGPTGSAPTPGPDTEVVDCRGLTALPGLINCHTHVAIDPIDLAGGVLRRYPKGEPWAMLAAAHRGRLCLEAGITTIRDCNAPGHGIFGLRDAFDGWLLPGPRMLLNGVALCATGGHTHVISRVVDGPESVTRAVREQLAAGADFIKLMVEGGPGLTVSAANRQELSDEEITAAVRSAHDLGRPVTAHAVSPRCIDAVLEAGIDCVEHGTDATDRQLEQMAQRGTWLVPTLAAFEAPIRNRHLPDSDPERVRTAEAVVARGLATVSRALAAGVRIACGSDGGSPGNPVWQLLPELRLLAAGGMTPSQVIRSATTAAAELCRMADSVGTLAVGKLADVIVVDGDPVGDLAVLEAVRLVLKDGRMVRNELGSERRVPASLTG